MTSVAKNPHYTATDQAWTNWAHDNQSKGRISAFAMLLAAFIFLYFIATIRSGLERAEASASGSVQLARVAFAGALTGIVGTTMAFITIAAASSAGAGANPVVSRAVTVSSTGPFLVGAVGFAAFLMAAGTLTLRSGVFSRWTVIVALVGAACWLVHVPDRPQQHRKRKRVRLRVLSRPPGAHHLDDCDERGRLPRGGRPTDSGGALTRRSNGEAATQSPPRHQDR